MHIIFINLISIGSIHLHQWYMHQTMLNFFYKTIQTLYNGVFSFHNSFLAHRFFCSEMFQDNIFRNLSLSFFFFKYNFCKKKIKKNSAIVNNKTLYKYYQNIFSDEHIKENFLQLIYFFNNNHVSINETLCKLIIQCDVLYCTKFMSNITLFFTYEKFKNITIQQFSE